MDPPQLLLKVLVLDQLVDEQWLSHEKEAIAVGEKEVRAGEDEELIRSLQSAHPRENERLDVSNVDHLERAEESQNLDLSPGSRR